jgi:putative ABC transport system substrate-binding protein
MRRWEFIAATAALLVSPQLSRAQGAKRRIGVLLQGSTVPSWFLDSLRNHGWVDGKNLIIEARYAQSEDQLPALAAELVARSPDLLIGGGPAAASALKSATATIPIVFVAVANPVWIGLVQSLGRPGGNVTGFATLVPGFDPQQKVLMELLPTASKIAQLTNPRNPMHRPYIELLPQSAQELGVALPIVEATTVEELDIAFASAAAQHVDAISVWGDELTFRYAAQIAALAAKHRLPAAYLSRHFVTRGGLISYGPDFADLWFRAGGHVNKILKGAKPSDLPVEQPTKFILAINMKTAKALGLNVPLSLLARADEVIE